MSRLKLQVCVVAVCSYASAQSNSSPPDCATPEIVLQRYAAAVGGEVAVDQIKTLVIEADESEPHTFNPQDTAHYRYQFKWRSPNQVTVKQRYFIGSTTFIFDGATWSNFDGKVSHNEDHTPASRLKLRADYPYNDYPYFLVYRIVANPILLVTNKNLYRSFETLPGPPETCALQARGTDEWGRERRDTLSFDVKTGFLMTWTMQAGVPGHVSYVQFLFNDYRQSGAVKIPFSIYFDFYKATFRITKVAPNAPIPAEEFVAKQ